jgi:hypothetical protein
MDKADLIRIKLGDVWTILMKLLLKPGIDFKIKSV